LLFHVPSFAIGLILGTAVVLITGYLPELLAPPSVSQPAGAGARPATGSSQEAGVHFEFDQILRQSRQQLAQQAQPDPAPAAAPPAPIDATAALPPGTPVGEPESASPGVVGETTGAPPPESMVATRGIATVTAPAEPVEVVERAAPPPAAPMPGPAVAERSPPTGSSPARATERGNYMLQAASFRSRSDADRLRAELLLLDLPANTGEVNVGNSVWYRVTVGPFPDQAATDLARERMRERNLTAIPLHR
jgi:cell division protein FtsN